MPLWRHMRRHSVPLLRGHHTTPEGPTFRGGWAMSRAIIARRLTPAGVWSLRVPHVTRPHALPLWRHALMWTRRRLHCGGASLRLPSAQANPSPHRWRPAWRRLGRRHCGGASVAHAWGSGSQAVCRNSHLAASKGRGSRCHCGGTAYRATVAARPRRCVPSRHWLSQLSNRDGALGRLGAVTSAIFAVIRPRRRAGLQVECRPHPS